MRSPNTYKRQGCASANARHTTVPLAMTRYLHPGNIPSFKTVLQVSVVLRVGLILFSDLHDKYSVVKYTDIDYRVFSDAARFVLHPSEGNTAQGPLGKYLGLGEYVHLSISHL